MKRVLIIFLVLISCVKYQKEDKNLLISRIKDSISSEIEFKIREKIKDSLKKYEIKFENDEEKYLIKLNEVNFYKWKRDFLKKMPKEIEQEGFDREIEESFSHLDIIYTRKIKLKGKYKGKDPVINDFLNSIFDHCPELKFIFKGEYELDLKKEVNYFSPTILDEEYSNKVGYSCWCNGFYNPAIVIANDTIYSFDIFKGICRGLLSKEPIKNDFTE